MSKFNLGILREVRLKKIEALVQIRRDPVYSVEVDLVLAPSATSTKEQRLLMRDYFKSLGKYYIMRDIPLNTRQSVFTSTMTLTDLIELLRLFELQCTVKEHVQFKRIAEMEQVKPLQYTSYLTPNTTETKSFEEKSVLNQLQGMVELGWCKFIL